MDTTVRANEDALKPQLKNVCLASQQQVRKEIACVPEVVKDAIFFQLHERLARGKSPAINVKPKKLRPHIMQMSFPYKGDTYRALYSTKNEAVVLLLVVFQKKTNGQATEEISLAEERLKRWSA